jgi:hypothetical protein
MGAAAFMAAAAATGITDVVLWVQRRLLAQRSYVTVGDRMGSTDRQVVPPRSLHAGNPARPGNLSVSELNRIHIQSPISRGQSSR